MKTIVERMIKHFPSPLETDLLNKRIEEANKPIMKSNRQLRKQINKLYNPKDYETRQDFLDARQKEFDERKTPIYSLGKIAKQMGISYITLWRKLHRESGFFLYELELEYLLRSRFFTIETEEKFSKL